MPYNIPVNENKISNTTSKIQFIHQKSDLTTTFHHKPSNNKKEKNPQ